MTIADKPSKRVLFIGWDGAEPSLVSRLLAEGKLPNLAALSKSGFYASLPSTIRPESPTAWTTFSTVSNPGIHGVYGFMHQIENSYDFEFTSTYKVQVPFFWETLSRHGYRVALLNMPMAYPPRSVNGWLVCGLMAPGSDTVFTYPATLSKELSSRGYSLDADPLTPGEDRASYIAKMNRQVNERVAVARDLLGNLEWDFGAVIFTELDRLQHFFWADMEPDHPLHPKEAYPNAIADHYAILDHALGELTSLADQDTHVILMSDHGFAPCAKRFYINSWLHEEGLLSFRNQSTNRWNPILKLLRYFKKSWFMRKLKRVIWGDKSLIARAESHSFNQQIDWARTKAWFTETEGIRINLCGREPKGIVEGGIEYENLINDIRQRLLQVKDPSTGQSVVKAVYKRGEIYWGKCVDSAPDLIPEPYRDPNNVNSNYWLESISQNNSHAIFGTSNPYSGNHSAIGICASNRLPPFNIQAINDVSRWIMNVFGLEVEMGLSEDHADPIRAYDDAAEKRIKKRLHDLGYVD